MPQYLTKKPITVDHGRNVLSMEYKSLAVKVRCLAMWQDKSLLLPYTESIVSYSRLRGDHLTTARGKGSVSLKNSTMQAYNLCGRRADGTQTSTKRHMRGLIRMIERVLSSHKCQSLLKDEGVNLTSALLRGRLLMPTANYSTLSIKDTTDS